MSSRLYSFCRQVPHLASMINNKDAAYKVGIPADNTSLFIFIVIIMVIVLFMGSKHRRLAQESSNVATSVNAPCNSRNFVNDAMFNRCAFLAISLCL